MWGSNHHFAATSPIRSEVHLNRSLYAWSTTNKELRYNRKMSSLILSSCRQNTSFRLKLKLSSSLPSHMLGSINTRPPRREPRAVVACALCLWPLAQAERREAWNSSGLTASPEKRIHTSAAAAGDRRHGARRYLRLVESCLGMACGQSLRTSSLLIHRVRRQFGFFEKTCVKCCMKMRLRHRFVLFRKFCTKCGSFMLLSRFMLKYCPNVVEVLLKSDFFLKKKSDYFAVSFALFWTLRYPGFPDTDPKLSRISFSYENSGVTSIILKKKISNFPTQNFGNFGTPGLR